MIKGAKNADAGKKLIDWETSPDMQRLFAKHKINFVPAHPDVKTEASLAEVLKGATIFAIDDAYAGANRKRDYRPLGERKSCRRGMSPPWPGARSASWRRVAADPALAGAVAVVRILLLLFVLYPMAHLLERAFVDERLHAGALLSTVVDPATRRPSTTA